MTTLKQLREELEGAEKLKKAIGINVWGVSGFSSRNTTRKLGMKSRNVRSKDVARNASAQSNQEVDRAKKTGNKARILVATQAAKAARERVRNLPDTGSNFLKLDKQRNTIAIPRT